MLSGWRREQLKEPRNAFPEHPGVAGIETSPRGKPEIQVGKRNTKKAAVFFAKES